VQLERRGEIAFGRGEVAGLAGDYRPHLNSDPGCGGKLGAARQVRPRRVVPPVEPRQAARRVHGERLGFRPADPVGVLDRPVQFAAGPLLTAVQPQHPGQAQPVVSLVLGRTDLTEQRDRPVKVRDRDSEMAAMLFYFGECLQRRRQPPPLADVLESGRRRGEVRFGLVEPAAVVDGDLAADDPGHRPDPRVRIADRLVERLKRLARAFQGGDHQRDRAGQPERGIARPRDLLDEPGRLGQPLG
jgi:hypothetical protein